MEYGNNYLAYLIKSTEHVVGCGRVRWVTQCVSGLVCEPSKLRRLYNSSHNYELECKNSYILKYEKNTYHIVLEQPTLWLDNALPCQFIALINNLIVIVRVR
jgi:hypothetical protein